VPAIDPRAGLAAALAATLVLAACAGSGSTAATTAKHDPASSPAPRTDAGKTAPVPPTAGASEPLLACLRKQGVKHVAYGAGGQLEPPSTVSRAAFEEALSRCGVRSPGDLVSPRAAGGAAQAGRVQRERAAGALASPRLAAALHRFAACMHSHGVNLPAPDVGGRGPIFRGSSVSPSSPKFGVAEHACFTVIRDALPKGGSARKAR